MNYYAVIDTNVLVSAMLRWNSIPGKIMEEAFVGEIVPVLNEEVLKEYMDVLERPKFKFDKESIEAVIKGILKRGIFVNPEKLEEELSDSKDKVFYEIVMEKRKWDDAYLITGNIKHFPDKSFIVTPREMIEIMEQDK